MEDENLLAYCGLFCGDCIRYGSKAFDLANELYLELGLIKFNEYAKIKSKEIKTLKFCSEMMNTLNAINKLKCDIPCRLGGDGCLNKCEIVKCVNSKSYNGCWECQNFEKCEKFEFLKPFHGNGPQKNCESILKYGFDNWTNHRTKFYPWS